MQPRKIALATLLLGALPATYVSGHETHTQLPPEKPEVARVDEPPVPKVELNSRASYPYPVNWLGKSFSDIIPPNKIQRIIRTSEASYGHFGRARLVPDEATEPASHASFMANEQAAYDSLMAQAVESPEKATQWGWGATEFPLGELMVLTTDDQLFRIEIYASPKGDDSGVLIIYGQGKGARIKVSNSQFIKSRLGESQTIGVAESPLPKVELNFTVLGSKTWIGKRFRDIIPPPRIQRITLVVEQNLSQHSKEYLAVQAHYDALIAQLIASPEKAKEWRQADSERLIAFDRPKDTERPLTQLMVLTTDDELFRIEILKGVKDSGAVLVYGQGANARIEVSHSQFMELGD